MGTLLRDLRYGLRMVLNKPGFSATAILVLALGIGANTAVFSLVNTLLLKPLRIQNPQELVGVFSRSVHQPDNYRPFSYPDYADLRASNAVFSSLAAHNLAMVGISEGDASRRAFADVVSSNYFATFGVPLFRGRMFTAAEELPGASSDVVIVSYNYWKKAGSDPALLGKTLRVNSRIVTVIGIAAEGFTGTSALLSPELYLPMSMYDAMMNDFDGRGRQLAARDSQALLLIGRVGPGVTQAAANSQLQALAHGMNQDHPAATGEQTFLVGPLSRVNISPRPEVNNPVTVPMILLLSMASVVLLIASLNVANMMLARGAARRKEIAIRMALGGGKRSILQQLFVEGLILALAGGAASLLVADWSTAALVRSLDRVLPLDLAYSAGPDVRVLAAAIGFCLLSTLVFGLAPAWNLTKSNVTSGLKDGEHEDVASGKRRRLFSRRNVLVMSQVALSLVLLTSAGLFIRSAQRAANVEPGFQLDHSVLLETDASMAGYDEAHGRQVYRKLLERLGSIPGVESVSVAGTVPFGMVSLGRSIQRASDPAPAPSSGGPAKSTLLSTSFNIVGPYYFKTLGIPMLRGRSFAAAETADVSQARVAILDQAAASKLWPHEDAVGKHIRMVLSDGVKTQDAEVIGVAGAIRDDIFGNGVQPHLYVPFGQEYQSNMNIHLKVAGQGPQAEALLGTIRGELRAVDSRLPILELKTLRDHLETSDDLWVARTGARMFGIFGAVALLLAMAGLYGVRAYTVARRTREIGIRMALGASAGDTLRGILREGVIVTLIGTGIGLVLAIGVGKVLSSFLYQVSSVDPLVFSGAVVVLAAISLLACYLPARRAARIDPMVALRYE
jgi:predicted permease